MNDPKMNTIEITALSKKYKDLTAVDGVNLSIAKGEIFGLLGPNGAGKTTLLMMLSTLLKPTAGKALVNGYDVIKQPAKVRKSIAWFSRIQVLMNFFPHMKISNFMH